ncbi:hypothetical protein HFO61_30470 [Rhizobium leguminosarum]|uniref:hypothetical protein n=1 Tax=Rhizobium leguminosarum TaxID=384 RepID=UPI001C9677C2|nr:hypothetical protein [Rhizobium leguminosarum]MBY5551071.1 hypothetical protein [Rhizobium leguminosarum]
MKTIKLSWREEAGKFSLAVEYSRMWPFEIEEIEQIAAKWGFAVNSAGQRQLGDLSGRWTPPESAEAIPAMRNSLREIGVKTIFEGEEE